MTIRPMTSSDIMGIWPQARSAVPFKTDEELAEWCLSDSTPGRAFCDERGPARGYLMLLPWKDLPGVSQVVCTKTDGLLAHAQELALSADLALISPLGSPWELRPYRKAGFRPLQPVLSFLKSDRLAPTLPAFADADRLGSVADLVSLRRLDDACFPAFWRLSDAEAEAASRSRLAFGITDGDGRLVGYVSAIDYGHMASVGRLAVLPEYRRQGLGAALLATVIRALHAQGVMDISVSTQADNQGSQSLYRSFGFTFASEWALLGWPHPADDPVWQL